MTWAEFGWRVAAVTLGVAAGQAIVAWLGAVARTIGEARRARSRRPRHVGERRR